MIDDANELFEKYISEKTPEEIQRENEERNQVALEEYEEFKRKFEKDECYIYGKPLKTISKSKPCLHWLLRRCKFRKKDFKKVFARFSYVQIASYLRWVANEEVFLKNINDLESEKTPGKILQYTIKWKEVEWTFDCSENDLRGHKGTKSEYPHYHFQMKIDGKQFINFNDYHIPFSKNDEFVLSMKYQEATKFDHNFGPGGAGMEDAMNIDFNKLFAEGEFSSSQANSLFHMQSIITSDNEDGIPLEKVEEAFAESKETGKSATMLLHEKLGDEVSIKTLVSPSDDVPDISKRSGRKKGKT